MGSRAASFCQTENIPFSSPRSVTTAWVLSPWVEFWVMEARVEMTISFSATGMAKSPSALRPTISVTAEQSPFIFRSVTVTPLTK